MSTKIVFILDRSGSMSGLEKDVIGGFNSFISEQKKLKEDKATVTTILFDNYYEVLHDNVDLQKMEPINNRQYFVRGSTALLDAVGRTIKMMDSRTKKKDIVLFVINTDGMENSSHEFTNAQIKEMVEHYQSKHDWKFIFLGANIDAFSVGGNMGFTYTYNYQNNSQGIYANYAAVGHATSTLRGSRGSSMDTSKLEDLDNNTTFTTSNDTQSTTEGKPDVP